MVIAVINSEFQRSSILTEIQTLNYYPVDVSKWVGVEKHTPDDEDLEKAFTEAASRMPQALDTILEVVKRTARMHGINDADHIAVASRSVIVDLDRMKLPNVVGPLLNRLAKYRLYDARAKDQRSKRRFFKVMSEVEEVSILHSRCNDIREGIRILDRLLTLVPLEDDRHCRAAILRASPLRKDEQAKILGVSRYTVWRWKNDDVPIIEATVDLIPSLPMWPLINQFVYEGKDDALIGMSLGLSERRVKLARRYAKRLIKEKIKGKVD